MRATGDFDLAYIKGVLAIVCFHIGFALPQSVTGVLSMLAGLLLFQSFCGEFERRKP